MDTRRDIIIALSGSGTLYAAVPRGGARYTTRRCRQDGRAGAQEATFEGALLSVRQSPIPASGRTEDLVRCGALMFEIVPATYGRPVAGERMAAGGDSRGVHEVSSKLEWVGVMDIDRAWALDPMFRAFRNGARDWRILMQEQPFEQGDEHIEDESGSLQAGVRDRHYGEYLRDHALQRDAHLTRLGHEVLPVHRVVSNEDLDAGGEALASQLAGPGMRPLLMPAGRKHRNAMASSLERCWGAMRRIDHEAAPQAKAA